MIVSLHNVGTVKRKLYCIITSTATKKFQFHVGDQNLQRKSVRGVVSLYACTSYVILSTGLVHGVSSRNKFRNK